MANKHVCIDEIRGCEGNCIAINDYRVAGPKPWGGGIVVKNWVADVDDVIRSLNDNDVVKVVRCKDCKYRYTLSDGRNFCKERFPMGARDDDFCSYGKRREGE